MVKLGHGGIDMKIGRRDFLKAAAGAAGLVISDKVQAMASRSNMDSKIYKIERRKLGKTGAEVSIIGMGGIVVMNLEQQDANKIVADAFERGINYFDVAPSYGDAQLRLGPALKPWRDKCFLACKSGKRDRAGVEAEIKESLNALETDHFDLYQLHGITDVVKDVDAALGKGGAMEAIIEAKKNGVVRNIGFSAHSPEAAIAAMRKFDFDTILYPVNFGSHYKSGFECEVVSEAKRRGMGILAIKAMMKGTATENSKKKHPKCWYEPIDDPGLVRLALSWTLGQGVSACLPPGDENLFGMALGMAGDLRPLTKDEQRQLEEVAKGLEPAFPIASV